MQRQRPVRQPITNELSKGRKTDDESQDGVGGDPERAEGEGEGEGEGEETDEEKARKAKIGKSITDVDLQKSLEALAAIERTRNPATRKDALLDRAREGALSKSEQDELYQLLGGAAEPQTPALADAVTGGMMENESMNKAIDVSDYLASHRDELVKSLGMLAETIENDGRRQHEFDLVLAKAVYDQGCLIKGMSERLGVIETQPARQPMSAGVPGNVRVLNKPFAGGAPQGNRPSRSQVIGTLSTMMIKSVAEGREGKALCGADIAEGVSQFEQDGNMSKALETELMEVIGGTRQAS